MVESLSSQALFVCPSCQHKLECLLLYLAELLAQNRNVGVLHLTLTDRRERSKARGSLIIFVFRPADWEGDWKLGIFYFFLSFSFIVITKYIPMMENYGFSLAIWQLCLYLF